MHLWLTYVRLESGYQYDQERVVGTETELCHIRIENGKVAEIVSASMPLITELPTLDAHGLLALPTVIENHNHLDKTYVGGPWKSPIPAKNLVERLDLEEAELPSLLDKVQERAELLIQMAINAGTTHIRTHVNIDQAVKLKHLEYTRNALEKYKDVITYEIVAFPQHGLLRKQVRGLMREAMRSGATHVGNVDPGGVDNNVEASLHQMMEIAVEANADVDIHLHDPDYLGVYTMKKLADMTEAVGWQGRVAVSHAFGFGGVPIEVATDLADRFHHLGMEVISTVPFRGTGAIPPIGLLTQRGVKVSLGCDAMFSSWAPFGHIDVFKQVTLLGERFRWQDELSLSQMLGYATNGKTPLSREGKRVWPQVGDDATILFADASCTAEAVARRAHRPAVMVRGKIVAGSLNYYPEE